MYFEWYVFVISAVDVCVDYGGVNVFYVCFDLNMVLGFELMSVV